MKVINASKDDPTKAIRFQMFFMRPQILPL